MIRSLDTGSRSMLTCANEGMIHPRSMITSTIAMEEIVEKGFKALIHEKDKHIKILVDISA